MKSANQKDWTVGICGFRRIRSICLGELVKVNPNLVGVLSAGSSVEMPWQHCRKAILHGYLGGQASAGAVLDILTGIINPSGRLAKHILCAMRIRPTFRYFPASERTEWIQRGTFVGYRYYDTSIVRFQYPFGYGLSYTEFTYSGLKVDQEGVRFTITNTGKRDGAETAQSLYRFSDSSVFRPQKELKGVPESFL